MNLYNGACSFCKQSLSSSIFVSASQTIAGCSSELIDDRDDKEFLFPSAGAYNITLDSSSEELAPFEREALKSDSSYFVIHPFRNCSSNFVWFLSCSLTLSLSLLTSYNNFSKCYLDYVTISSSYYFKSNCSCRWVLSFSNCFTCSSKTSFTEVELKLTTAGFTC